MCAPLPGAQVRGQLIDGGSTEAPVWSGYTCFAAIANVVPDDIKDVGYKVFLGSRKYFVSVDVSAHAHTRARYAHARAVPFLACGAPSGRPAHHALSRLRRPLSLFANRLAAGASSGTRF